MNVGERKDWTTVFSHRYLGVSDTSQTELEFCCSIFCHVLLKYMSAWQKAISQRVLKAAFPLFNFNFKYRHSHSFQFVKCDLQHYAFNHPPPPCVNIARFFLADNSLKNGSLWLFWLLSWYRYYHEEIWILFQKDQIISFHFMLLLLLECYDFCFPEIHKSVCWSKIYLAGQLVLSIILLLILRDY